MSANCPDEIGLFRTVLTGAKSVRFAAFGGIAVTVVLAT